MQFIDRLPFSLLIVMTVLMLAAPFVPEPHLVEKMRMLAEGTLTKPLDIFDVLWHLLPATSAHGEGRQVAAQQSAALMPCLAAAFLTLFDR